MTATHTPRTDRLPLWHDVTRGDAAYVVTATASDGTVLPHYAGERMTFGEACTCIDSLHYAADEDGHDVTFRSTMAVIVDGVVYAVRRADIAPRFVTTAVAPRGADVLATYAGVGHRVDVGTAPGSGGHAYVTLCSCGFAATDNDVRFADYEARQHVSTVRLVLGSGVGVGVATMADVLADTCAAARTDVLAWRRRTVAEYGRHTVSVSAPMVATDDELESLAATDRAAWSALQARKAYRGALERLA